MTRMVLVVHGAGEPRLRDDPVVPLEHLEHYRRALPHAVVRLLDGRGHEFNQPEFPELVADIRQVGKRKD